MSDLPAAPIAGTRPHSVTHHGVTVEDPWAWLRDPAYPTVTDPQVLGYLAAENMYFEAAMAPHAALVETLFAEMKGRLKEDDASVPQRDGEWLYWWAFRAGAQYRAWWRRPAAGGDPQLLLDEAALAEGRDYFRLGALAVSPDGRLAAWSVDDDGSERFTLRIRDLATGGDLADVIPGTLGGIGWAADSTSFAYGVVNDKWRVDTIRLHRLGDDPVADATLYHEADEGFRVSIGLSRSRRFLILSAGDHVTSEVRLIPAADPLAAPILVSPRQAGREYEVEDQGERLLIRTNDDHVNFRIATAPLAAPGDWSALIPGSDDFYIRGHSAFRDWFAVEGRLRGLDQIRLHRGDDAAGHPIAFPEASYTAGLANNPEYAPDRLRLTYQSMVTPPTVYDYNPAADTLATLKVQQIPSGYDPARYRTERREIIARDGTAVPVSIVCPAGFPLDGTGALHLYGYGAYGLAIPPGFSTTRLSLLDRGIAFAIAHIRGGDDLGYRWYLDGKLDKRETTFDDFVDVARGLIAAGFTAPGRITASGGSAGGELMGAIINQAPELWGAVAAHVPFVDVLNTMLDATLPLTPGEWPEWGNPIEDEAAFHLIRGYSPYDNVRPQAYPPLLVTAGLNDPRVTYWEPAKWVARLRATTTGTAPILLKTNMGAGHGGKSGRYESLREVAEEYAFMLWQLGRA